jgi:uncharacterized membrane protein
MADRTRTTSDTRTMPVPGTAIGAFVVALLGLAIAAYLTIEHYNASTTLACPETGAINCAKVTTSSWSHIGSMPVAVLGLLFFAGMTLLCSPPAWRHRSLDPIRVVGATVGVASALYLIWVELFRVDAICLWCTAVHVCTLLLLALVLWTFNTRRTS